MRAWVDGVQVHSGFKARMFPDKARTPRSLREHFERSVVQVVKWVKGHKVDTERIEMPVRTPYGKLNWRKQRKLMWTDSIREGIQIVADHLTKNTGIHSINVYFTGHSLGCATASLAYARAVAKQSSDYKSNVRIRDAYMFAAPVIGDVKTRDAFNVMMGAGLPRSMWRVSNVGMVAPCELG